MLLSYPTLPAVRRLPIGKAVLLVGILAMAACGDGEMRRPLTAAPPPPPANAPGATAPAAPAPALSPLPPVTGQAGANQPGPGQTAAGPAAGGTRAGRPLLVISFDKPKVDYGPALYQVSAQALQRVERAVFEIVEYRPDGQSASSRRSPAYGQEVAETLLDMGLPPTQLSVLPPQPGPVRYPEVRIFVR